MNDSTKTCSTSLSGISLDIPSHLDTTVRECSEWEKTLVHKSSFKAEVEKARDVVLAKGLDLNQLHSD
jgi:hypothetical protein